MEISKKEYDELIERSADLHSLLCIINESRLRNYYPKKEMPLNHKIIFALNTVLDRADLIESYENLLKTRKSLNQKASETINETNRLCEQIQEQVRRMGFKNVTGRIP